MNGSEHVSAPHRRPRPGALTIVTAAMVALAAGVLGFLVAGDDKGTGRLTATGQGQHSPETTTVSPTTITVASTVPVTTTPTTTTPTTLPERLGPDSRLSLQGVGPVAIGMSLAEASAAAGVPIRFLEMPPGPECRYAVPDRASGTGDELGFMVVDGRIVRIDVGIMGPDRIRTVSGVGKGDTEAKVQDTYPGRIRIEPHPYIPNGHDLVYVPSDPSLRHLSMIFETVDGRVTSFRAGLAEQVSWPEGCS